MQFMVKAIIAGWLCDLAAHKEILCWKGWQGNRCCSECLNLHRKHLGPMAANGDVGIDCADEAKWNKGTKEQIFAIVDDLGAKHHTLGKTAFENLQKEKGNPFLPLLFNSHESPRSERRR